MSICAERNERPIRPELVARDSPPKEGVTCAEVYGQEVGFRLLSRLSPKQLATAS